MNTVYTNIYSIYIYIKLICLIVPFLVRVACFITGGWIGMQRTKREVLILQESSRKQVEPEGCDLQQK